MPIFYTEKLMLPLPFRGYDASKSTFLRWRYHCVAFLGGDKCRVTIAMKENSELLNNRNVSKLHAVGSHKFWSVCGVVEAQQVKRNAHLVLLRRTPN